MLKHIKNLLKANSLVLAILITIVIAILSLAKISKQPINFNHIDKVEHCIAYGVLCFFWLLALGKTYTNRLLIISICISYGIVIEVLQGTTNYRTFDFVDMIANSAGVLIGLLVFIFLVKNKNLAN